MTTQRLVAPIEFDPSPGLRGVLQRVGAAGLRLAWDLSERWVHGRGSLRLVVLAGAVLGHHGQVAFRMASGARLLVGQGDRYWVRHALYAREYEPEIDAFLSRLLRPADGFVDCGANIGLWSVSAARVVAQPERVVAVEPAGRPFGYLQRNCEVNGQRFTLLRRAVSTRDGDQVELHVSLEDHASSTTIADLAPPHAQLERVETVSLRSLLDRLRSSARFDQGGEPIVVIKLDVEGLEEELFESLDPAVDDSVVVVYEDHGRDLSHSASVAARRRGFDLAAIRDDGSLVAIADANLSDLDVLKTSPLLGYNLVAVAPSGSARQRLSDLYQR